MTLRHANELVRRWEFMRVDTVTCEEFCMRSNFEREESKHASNLNITVTGDNEQQDTSDDEQQDKVTKIRSGQLYPPATEANKSLNKEISIN